MEAVSSIVRVSRALRAWAEQPEVRAALLALQEWATVDSRLQEHRERWEQKDIPIRVEEAEYALRCLGYAAFNKPVELGQYLAHELENTPSEEVIARGIIYFTEIPYSPILPFCLNNAFATISGVAPS